MPAVIGDEDTWHPYVRLRGQQVAGMVLAAGTVAGLRLAMIDAATFWIAQALLAGLVLAEVAGGLTRLWHPGAFADGHPYERALSVCPRLPPP